MVRVGYRTSKIRVQISDSGSMNKEGYQVPNIFNTALIYVEPLWSAFVYKRDPRVWACSMFVGLVCIPMWYVSYNPEGMKGCGRAERVCALLL